MKLSRIGTHLKTNAPKMRSLTQLNLLLLCVAWAAGEGQNVQVNTSPSEGVSLSTSTNGDQTVTTVTTPATPEKDADQNGGCYQNAGKPYLEKCENKYPNNKNIIAYTTFLFPCQVSCGNVMVSKSNDSIVCVMTAIGENINDDDGVCPDSLPSKCVNGKCRSLKMIDECNKKNKNGNSTLVAIKEETICNIICVFSDDETSKIDRNSGMSCIPTEFDPIGMVFKKPTCLEGSCKYSKGKNKNFVSKIFDGNSDEDSYNAFGPGFPFGGETPFGQGFPFSKK